jgi:tetratricopeptide (TPR) repeat protein
MAKPVLIPITALAAVLLVSACDVSSPHISVLRGNHAFEQGNYQAATVHYLEHWDNQTYDPWIAYNLGNVYHFLGEFDAAEEMWRAAGEEEDEELRFAVAFNTGVMAYELAQYNRAYTLFRDALMIDSSSVAAKRNLELALRKLEAGEGIEERGDSGEQEQSQEELSSDAVRILEYVRRKEGAQWVAPDQQQPTQSGRDW